MKQSSSIIGLLAVSGAVVAPWQVTSFTAATVKNQQHRTNSQQPLHSSLSTDEYFSYSNNNNNQQQREYFNSPSYPSHELRWALKVQVGLDERNVYDLLNDDETTTTTTSQTAAASTPVISNDVTTTMSSSSQGRTVVRAIENVKQAYQENREVEAYNRLNNLEKQQRKMDGPSRSRLEMKQPLTSIRSQQVNPQENFVFQYADAESVEFTKTVDDIVQGTLLEDVLVRTAAEFGKQSASLLGGNDPENWID